MRLRNFLISLLVLLLTSCYSHRYDIIWHSFGFFTDHFITITFWDHINSLEYEYNLIPNKTNYIKVPNGISYSREEMPNDVKMVIYPSPASLPNGGKLEIFLYNPEIEQIDKENFNMKRQEGVEAYFVKFSKGEKRYYAISKDEIISPRNEIIFDNINQLLDIVQNEDIIFFDNAGTENYNGAEQFWGGYIVKTKQDNNYLWLNHSFPWF